MEGRRRREYCWICRRRERFTSLPTPCKKTSPPASTPCAKRVSPSIPSPAISRSASGASSAARRVSGRLSAVSPLAWKQCYPSDRYDSPSDVDQPDVMRRFDALEFDVEDLKRGTKVQERELALLDP